MKISERELHTILGIRMKSFRSELGVAQQLNLELSQAQARLAKLPEGALLTESRANASREIDESYAALAVNVRGSFMESKKALLEAIEEAHKIFLDFYNVHKAALR